MPHVPGIGGFVGQMAPLGLPPMAIRDQRLSYNDRVARAVCYLPAYEIGDLLVIQFVAMNGAVLNTFTFEGDGGWIAAPQQLVTTSGQIHVIACYWRFATDKSLTQVTYLSSGHFTAPDWAANAVSISGADKLKTPAFSNWYSTSAALNHNPPNDWSAGAPVGPTLYVAMGGIAGGATISAWPAEVPNNRLNNTGAGTVRPHQASTKLIGGGALDIGIYTISAMNQFCIQTVGARGDG